MIKKEMDKMEFQFYITEEDYLAFNQYSLLNSTAGKRTLFTLRTYIPAIFMLLMLLLMLTTDNFGLFLVEAIMSVFVAILIILLSKRILLQSVKGSIKNYKKDGKLPYSETGRLIFGEEGITEITTDMENRKNYSQIEKVCVTSKGLYLFFNCSEACILTDSCFSSQEEKEQLLSFLHNKIDPSRFFY